MPTVTVYHNMRTWFEPYQDGQLLAAVTSYRLPHTVDRDAHTVAEWAFHVCNADLDDLETHRETAEGETAFLAACVYRLLGCRSLSTGDVVDIAYDAQDGSSGHNVWLACEPIGWRQISEPSNRTGEPLTAAKVYQHLQRQRADAVPSRG